MHHLGTGGAGVGVSKFDLYFRLFVYLFLFFFCLDLIVFFCFSSGSTKREASHLISDTIPLRPQRVSWILKNSFELLLHPILPGTIGLCSVTRPPAQMW